MKSPSYDAKRLILAGEAPEGLSVSGDLWLRGCTGLQALKLVAKIGGYLYYSSPAPWLATADLSRLVERKSSSSIGLASKSGSGLRFGCSGKRRLTMSLLLWPSTYEATTESGASLLPLLRRLTLPFESPSADYAACPRCHVLVRGAHTCLTLRKEVA